MKLQKSLIKSLSLIFLLLIIATSCSNDSTAPNDGKSHKNHSLLLGTWENKQDSYTETYIYSLDGFDGGSYKMEVEKIIWSSDNSGIIYGNYTKNDYVSGVVGKYYAVSFKDLTDSGVSISGAYKQDGKTGARTLIEAIIEFTVNKGYYSIYSSCVKKK